MNLINTIKGWFGIKKEIPKVEPPKIQRKQSSGIIHSTSNPEPLMRHLDGIIDKHHF